MIFKRSQALRAELQDVLLKYSIEQQCNCSVQEIADEIFQLLLKRRAVAISKNF